MTRLDWTDQGPELACDDCNGPNPNHSWHEQGFSACLDWRWYSLQVCLDCLITRRGCAERADLEHNGDPHAPQAVS